MSMNMGYSRVWHLETLGLEIRFDWKHGFGEEVACLVNYVGSIGSDGHFGSGLETGNSTSIRISVSKCQILLYLICNIYKCSVQMCTRKRSWQSRTR
jgi:hypothetical protein